MLLINWCSNQFLTRTVWWAIPVIWLPVVCWSISMSVSMGHTLPQIALMVFSGIFIWTLMEYSLHRFLFHIETKSYWWDFSFFFSVHSMLAAKSFDWTYACRGNTIHYLLHGCHHKHPMDGLRLVFPPTATAVLCIPVSVALSWWYAPFSL